MSKMMFANNAVARLKAATTAASTTVQLQAGEGALFPQPTGGDFFKLTLDDRRTGQIEITHCTQNVNNILTVVRGQEGTTPQAFQVGAVAANRVTADTFASLQAAVDAAAGYTKTEADERFVNALGDSMAGPLNVQPPTIGTHAASKVYVDDGLATKAPTVHSHTIAQVTGLQPALDTKVDDAPVDTNMYGQLGGTWAIINWTSLAGKPASFPPGPHTHPWGEVTGKPSTFPPSNHTHVIAEVTGLETALSSKEPIISAGDVSSFWRGDKTWQPLSSITVDAYTKAQSDAKYEPFDSAYTKAEADARYEPFDSAYTKAEDDARFATKVHTHTATDITNLLPGGVAAGLMPQNASVPFTGKVTFGNPASMSAASINLPGGSYASTTSGDIWRNSSGDLLMVRSGVTQVFATLQLAQTWTAKQTFPAAVTGAASIRVPHGTTPTTFADGDLWSTTAGFFIRVSGATLGPLGAPPDAYTKAESDAKYEPFDSAYTKAESNTLLAAKEPTIATGNASYFWAGDKTWKAPVGGAVVAENPPASPTPGTLHWDSDTGRLLVWFVDVNSSQWVEVAGTGAGGVPQIIQSDTAPPFVLNGLWWNTSNGVLSLGYRDANTDQWVAIVGGGTLAGSGAYLPLAGGVVGPGNLKLNKPTATSSQQIQFTTAGILRWELDHWETGEFFLSRYSAAGVYVDSPIWVKGDTGRVFLNMEDQAWKPIVFQNSWVNYGSSYGVAAYRKLGSGLVIFQGLCAGGTTAPAIAFTLPAGYRPGVQLIFNLMGGTNVANRCDVQTNGGVTIQVTGTNAYMSLANIAFYAEG